MNSTPKQIAPVLCYPGTDDPLPPEYQRPGAVWQVLRQATSVGVISEYIDQLAYALVSVINPRTEADPAGERGELAYDCWDDLIAGDRGPTSETVLRSVQRSVQQSWALVLPMQQQSVLLLAARGPDGIAKDHPIKPIVQAYRATVLNAAHTGVPFTLDEDEDRAQGDTFMTLEFFRRSHDWKIVVDRFFRSSDNVPHHYLLHLAHGAQIIGYKHPSRLFRGGWLNFYLAMVEDMHLNPENEEQMDARLNDWGREHWRGGPQEAER